MTTQVRRYVVVNAPVERVWQALLEADQLERWLCQRAEVDISSCIYKCSGCYLPQGVRTGPILQLEPRRRLVVAWNPGDPERVTFTVRPHEGLTRVEVAHDAGRQASPGWTLITETLWAYYTTLLRQWLEMGEVGFRLDFCNADRRIIEQSIECPVSAATAFAALTDPAHLRNWIAENATVELRVGGRYSLGWGAEGTDGPGRILRLQPGRSLGYSWFEGGRLTEVDWLVEDLGNRCRIILRHGDFTDHPHQHLGCSLGWADWINVLWLYLREFRDMRAWRGSAHGVPGNGADGAP